MRRVIAALAVAGLVLIVGSDCVLGGTDSTATKVYDPKCPRCPKSTRPRLGGGGGPVPGYIFADLGVINAQVKKMGIPKVPEAIFVMGGKGYARFGNIIIGGGGYGGSSESSGMPDESARHATVDLGYGGGIIGIDLARCRCELTAGLLLGAGSVAVTRKIASQGVFDWGEAWDIFGKDLPDSIATDHLTASSRLTADFWAIEPFVELRVRVTPYLAIGLAGSYLRAHVGKATWKMDGLDILNSPEADLGGPSAKLGLIFGS
jgi:hypothetical protein